MIWKHVLLAALLSTPCAGALAQVSEDFAYDALGRVTRATASDGSYSSFGYDAANNRTRTSQGQSSRVLQAWEAETLPHLTGYTVQGGRAADASQPAGYLSYGPYTSQLPTGPGLAVWKILIDNHTLEDGGADIVRLDVHDSTTGAIVAQRTLKRRDWSRSGAYEFFFLPYELSPSQAGNPIELRTYYFPSAYVKLDRVGVNADTLRDESLADAAWVWQAESLSHLVGYAQADGWASDVTTPAGHLTYGPYGTFPTGPKIAIWKMMTDDNTYEDDGLPVVQITINDATAGEQIATRILTRKAWEKAGAYEYFGMPIDIPEDRAGNLLEFQTYYFGAAHLRVDWVGLR